MLSTLLPFVLCGGCEAKGPAPAPAATPTGSRLAEAPASGGFVVWESNRGGAFRIWRQELAGGSPRQISPDEAGRDHCCAKLSPDGRRLVYLSVPGGARAYGDAAGALHLADADGGRDRILVEPARHYGEHRAAVWWGIDQLVHLDGAGASVRRVLSTGESERLVGPGVGSRPREGWLIAPGGRIASGNTPTFSDLDPQGRMRERPSLGGCQPAFSADGRVAVWAAGAGGPIDAIELETRRTWTVVARHDPRLPKDRGYVYFPMLSADRRGLALAGSAGAHDHFTADYDILALELDPVTLSPLGEARRIAPHPAVDRFPDLFVTAEVAPPLAAGGPAPESAAASKSPDRERGLVLTWERGDAANRVRDDGPGTLATARGLAWLDRDRSMALGGGRFETDREVGSGLVAALESTNQWSLGVRLAPASTTQEGTLLALSGGPRRRALLLVQRGGELALVLRTSDSPREGAATRLAPLDATRPIHLLLSFSPGRLRVFVDGRPAGSEQPLPGDLFPWQEAPLVFGAEPGSDASWRGTLSHLAVWNRPLEAGEAAAEAERVRAAFASAAPIERAAIEARVIRASAAPSLESISPYREALAVDEIEVVRSASGPLRPGARILRVRWAILDGVPLATPRAGDVAALVLEPFAGQPQLEPYFLADEIAGDAPLWFDLGASAAP